MFGWIVDALGWLFRLWEKFPDSAKEKIVDEVVEAVSKWFEDFYDEIKKTQGN